MLLTAQDIQAMANTAGTTIAPWGVKTLGVPWWNNKACARKTVANATGMQFSMRSPQVINAVFEKFGLSQLDQEALEEGFEQFDPEFEDIHAGRRNEFQDNYYYAVGQELRTTYEINQKLDVFV